MFERYSDSARRLLFMSLWSARRRGGSYIEPEDLLHGIIRDDRGEFGVISHEVFPGCAAPDEESVGKRHPFFPGDVAADVLRELHEDPDPLSRPTAGDKLEPAPHVDLPVSRSMKDVLTLVAQAHQHDTKTIEPLDLLAGLVANQDTKLAQLLRDHGITRQKVAEALDAGS
jgi:hypothetical protein